MEFLSFISYYTGIDFACTFGIFDHSIKVSFYVFLFYEITLIYSYAYRNKDIFVFYKDMVYFIYHKSNADKFSLSSFHPYFNLNYNVPF